MSDLFNTIIHYPFRLFAASTVGLALIGFVIVSSMAFINRMKNVHPDVIARERKETMGLLLIAAGILLTFPALLLPYHLGLVACAASLVAGIWLLTRQKSLSVQLDIEEELDRLPSGRDPISYNLRQLMAESSEKESDPKNKPPVSSYRTTRSASGTQLTKAGETVISANGKIV